MGKLWLKTNMKRETRKKIVNEVGQAQQVTISLNLEIKKDKTITCERSILTRLIKRLITTQRDEVRYMEDSSKLCGATHQVTIVLKFKEQER